MGKALNNEQRKILSKLYAKQFEAKRTEREGIRQQERKEFLAKKDASIKDKDFDEYIKLSKRVEELEHLLADRYKDGTIQFDTKHYGTEKAVLRYRRDGYQAEIAEDIVKFGEESKKQRQQVDIAEQDAQARIYGLDVTFAEIQAEVENILKAL